jgi:hypothetical protein
MRRLVAVLATIGAVVAAPPAAPATESKRPIETLVFVRHGEKPKDGLGLLTCKGLNRALKLPAFFASNFPRPDFIFAPDPSVKATEIHGDGQRYDYVRPLLTIGPTAVRLGVPVNTQLPYNDPGLLADTLLDPRYHDATVYIVWEHLNIGSFAEILLKRFASAARVPEWSNADYDTVFVFTIDWSAPASLKFEVRSENLGPLADTCPQ